MGIIIFEDQNRRNAEEAAGAENIKAQDYYLNHSHALQTAYEQVLNDIKSGLEILSKTNSSLRNELTMCNCNYVNI